MSITSSELHRSRPLRSSPLAGPAVVSLGDQQLVRPVSVHSPLGSKSNSFQTLSRPVSLYGAASPPPPWQSPHRRRPSTAPGPARPNSAHSSLNDDDGLAPNLHVRYSSSLLSVPSGLETRPSSISLDPEGPLKSPRPILKHSTSFQPSLSSLSSSASSTHDARFSAADKGKGKMNASASRLSTDPAYGVPTAKTDESWYTFSPYATTPKFSRLGLASAGVVMPVSAKELARSKSSASRARSQSAGAASQGLSRTISSTSSSMRGTDEQGVLSNTRSDQQAQPQRPLVPVPGSGSASGSPSTAAWLNVPPPARTRIGKGSVKATARGTALSSPVDASAASSRSSTSTRRTSTTSFDNSAASSSTSLPSSASCQQLPQVKTEEKGKREKRKSLSLSLGLKSWRSLRVASTSASGLDNAGKEQDGSTIIPLPSPPLPAHFPDSPPTSPNPATATPIAIVTAPSVPEAESMASILPTSSATGQTAITPTSTSTSPLPPNLTSPPPRNSTSSSNAVSAPSSTQEATSVNKLKKRKSTSAALARVRSWRWGSSGKAGRGADADAASVEAAPVPAPNENVNAKNAEEGIEAEVQPKVGVEAARAGHGNIVESSQQGPLEDDANEPNTPDHAFISTEKAVPVSSASTSTATSSPSLSPAPTFAPGPTQLDTLIPSPNLHVSSDTVPGYIQSQLQIQTPTETHLSPAVLALVEAMAPVLTSIPDSSSSTMTPASSSISCSSLSADVAVSEGFAPSSSCHSTLTLVSEQHGHESNLDDEKDLVAVQEMDEAPQNYVAVFEPRPVDDDDGDHVVDQSEAAAISVPGAPSDSDDMDSILAVVRSPSPTDVPISPSPEVVAPAGPLAEVPTSADTAPLPPSPSPCSTPAPAQTTASVPAQTTTPTANPTPPSVSALRERSRSRSKTRSLSKSRPRSGSVRRMWNAFVCGGADAEQLAVEAWAEVQAGQKAAGDLGHTNGGRGRGVARDVKGRRKRESMREVEMEMDKSDAVVMVAVVPAGVDVP